jgi:hypothetical protein
MTCYFTCVEGFTFKSVIVGSMRWSDMEWCAIVHNVIFPTWMAKLTHFKLWFLLAYDVCCVGNLQEPPLC